MVEALSISALERETGVPRSTIHFYVRAGLLPQPQKTAASRSLYSRDHARLLQRIRELKDSGNSLAEIRAALETDLARAEENGIDLASHEYERIHQAILRAATESFATRGYDRTHVADIVSSAGITPQVFYHHFTSKLQLLVESFHTFITWNLAFVEPQLESSDLGERLLARLLADVRANEFGSEVMARIRSDGERSGEEQRVLAEQAWASVVRYIIDEFEAVIPPGASPPRASLELLAYSMLGAQHNASMRASWDDTFSRADILRTHVWLWLAVVAGLSGEVDIDARVARYEGLIQQAAKRRPETPPARDENEDRSSEHGSR